MMIKDMKYSVILLVAGKSTRFNNGINKVYCLINNKPVFRYSFDLFFNDDRCNEIIVVHNDVETLTSYLRDVNLDNKEIKFVSGGDTRNKSVLNGLSKVSGDYVLVHDGARPVITKELIDRVIDGFYYSNAVTVSLKVTDTIKETCDGIVKTLNRNNLISVQTPQGCKTELLRNVLKKASANGDEVFDDMEAVEKYSDGENVYFVEGDKRNIKLTTIEDLEIIELYLNKLGGK